MIAVADDWTIQEGIQQLAVGDDRCGEIDLVYAAEKNGFIASDPAVDPDGPASYVQMIRQDLGMDPMTGGTTLPQLYQAAMHLAARLNCSATLVPIVPAPGQVFNFSDWPGWWAIIATRLSFIFPQVEGDHFLLFDGNVGLQWHCLDSCHDVDGALGHPDGYLPIDDVLRGSAALFEDPAAQVGWLVKFTQPGASIVTPTPPPSNETLQNQNGLNAQGEYDLGLALMAVAMDPAVSPQTRATILSKLFDGPASTFGQLNAISNSQFPVPNRP